jgi:hypothetical protein
MKIEEKIMFFLKRTRNVEMANITMFGNIFLAIRGLTPYPNKNFVHIWKMATGL